MATNITPSCILWIHPLQFMKNSFPKGISGFYSSFPSMDGKTTKKDGEQTANQWNSVTCFHIF